MRPVDLQRLARLANLPIVPLRGAAFWGSRFMTGQQQKSRVTKRSIVIAGHKTSVSLEDQFWDALREISTARGTSVGTLVSSIDVDRQHNNLSSAIRLFVLDHYRAQADARRSTEGPVAKDHAR
jgi:predicted DNA-binding ribbon-helix-helix protein